MANAGYWAIALTFVVSLYAGAMSIVGVRRRNDTLVESARNGAFVAATMATAASAALMALLLTRDFGIKYVYEHTSHSLPTAYLLSAFWSGQEGSLLLWLWLVTVITATVVLWRPVWGTPSGPYVLATMASVQAFLALVLLLISSPFERLPSVPVEGLGLNPLLQNFWMTVHPPVVFVGYAAYTVPFALAIGGLATGQMETSWLRAVRHWALLAWLFLGMGILMGAYWAYLELGWGGYWSWDPVENSSLVPWLTGTALLHSLMMQQRRQAFRTWNLWLIVSTFLLCLFATFITRSGIIQSVHAFGRSLIGAYFLAFILVCLLTVVVLLRRRGRALREQVEYRGLLSREAGFLLTNLLLGGAALVILLGTLFPALVEAIQGRQAALGTSFYEKTVGPLALLVILLMGVCPWLTWGGTPFARLRRELVAPALAALATTALLFALGPRDPVPLLALGICAFVILSLVAVFYRDVAARLRSSGGGIWPALFHTVSKGRRRYGAHLVHTGIVFIALGVMGSSIYHDEVQIALAPGEEVDLQAYTLHYKEFVSQDLPDQQQFTAVVEVSRGSRAIATLRPQKVYHWNVEQWVTEVAIHSTLAQDLYVILAGLEQDGLASFQVLVNPLVAWLWVGGALLLCGGIIAWGPSTSDRNRP